MEKKLQTAGETAQEIKKDNGMVVEFSTVSGYMAALEQKEKEVDEFSERLMATEFDQFINFIKKDFKGFNGDDDYHKYDVKAHLMLNPLKYLRLKYLQHDTSARNKIGDFIAAWNPNGDCPVTDMQNVARYVVRHADKFTENMEILDLCYYINFKLEEKED